MEILLLKKDGGVIHSQRQVCGWGKLRRISVFSYIFPGLLYTYKQYNIIIMFTSDILFEADSKGVTQQLQVFLYVPAYVLFPVFCQITFRLTLD